MPLRRPALPLAVLALMAIGACTTPEYRAERATCAAIWLERLPPEYRTVVITHFGWERTYAGQICVTQEGTTTCTPRYTSVFRPETLIERVDLRAEQRRAEIAACTRAACLARYGTPDCRPALQ